MSVTFYGSKSDGTRVSIPFEHPAFFQLANGNAVRFLMFLGFGDGLWGEVTLPEARRAVIRARATFDRRVTPSPAKARTSSVQAAHASSRAGSIRTTSSGASTTSSGSSTSSPSAKPSDSPGREGNAGPRRSHLHVRARSSLPPPTSQARIHLYLGASLDAL